jgi:hypothetical protein
MQFSLAEDVLLSRIWLASERTQCRTAAPPHTTTALLHTTAALPLIAALPHIATMPDTAARTATHLNPSLVYGEYKWIQYIQGLVF